MNNRERYNSLIGVYSKRYSEVLRDKDVVKNNEILRAAIKDLDTLCTDIRNHIDKVNLLKRAIQAEDSAFKNRRLGFIEKGIKNDLDIIFPKDHLRPIVTLDNSRGCAKASLTLKDRNGDDHNPQNFCSGLMKQLISFGAAFCICSLLGCRILFIDEAFGASSPNNKRKISGILQNAINNGFQIILISQGCELYDELSRHQINLASDGDKAILVNEEDINYGE